MASHKLDRTTEDIRRELSAIMREVKDPRVQGKLLSVVRVDLTNDLSYCTVYISTMEGLEASQEAVKGLKNGAGYIRHELGSRLNIRYTPKLIFKATDSIEYSSNLSSLLNNLQYNENNPYEEDEDTDDWDEE